MTTMRTIQDIQLELMRRASFNDFDGPGVVESLLAHHALWEAALMDTDNGPMYHLRDLSANYWNVSTLHIIARNGRERELEALARTWGADEVAWHPAGNEKLGGRGGNGSTSVLRVWWD